MFDIVPRDLTVTVRRNGSNVRLVIMSPDYGRLFYRRPFYGLPILDKDLEHFQTFCGSLLTLSRRLSTTNSQRFFGYKLMIVRRVIDEQKRLKNDIDLMHFQLNCVERWVKVHFRTIKCSGMYLFYQEIIEAFLSILRSQITAEIIKFQFVLGCMPSNYIFLLIQRLSYNPAEPFLGPMRVEIQQIMSSLMYGRSESDWKMKFNCSSFHTRRRPFGMDLQIAYPGTVGTDGAADGAAGGAAGGGTAGGGTAANNMDLKELQAMYD
jgi:hypothetical protein